MIQVRCAHFYLMLVLSLATSTQANVQCSEVYLDAWNQQRVESFLKKIERLNPELVQEFQRLPTNEQSLAGLYLVLKNEGWLFLPNGQVPFKNKPELSEEIVQLIREQSPRSYDTQNLKPDELYIFYANALQGLYLNVARAIRQDFVRSIAPLASKDVTHFLERIYDRLETSDLGRSETLPDLAREALAVRPIEQVDWLALTNLATRWFQQKPQDPQTWIEKQPEAENLSHHEQQLFTENINRKDNARRHCCLTNPGCLFCPNNRGFLAD